MKKLIVISLIALLSVTAFAQGEQWGKDIWRIPTYKEDFRIIKLNNAFTGTDYCLSRSVDNSRIFKSFIFVHSSTTKYLELKLDCLLLSETTVDGKYNDRVSLIKYNKPKDKTHAIVFSEFDKNKKLKQTVIIVEFNKAKAEAITNTVEKIVFVTNTVQSAESSEVVNPLDNINFKFHKGVTYE